MVEKTYIHGERDITLEMGQNGVLISHPKSTYDVFVPFNAIISIETEKNC